MEVVVDGRTGLTPQEGITFRTLFETLRKSVKTKRRAIIAWTLDGERLTLDRQEALADESPAGFGLLEIKTVDPFEISLNTLTGLRTHLDTLAKNHDEAVRLVEAEEFSKALDKLDACFTGWDILARVVHDIGNLSEVNFKAMKIGDRFVETIFRSLQDCLMRFSGALEFKDLGRSGEIVRDELRPMLGHWRALLEAVGQHVARASGIA